MRRDERREPTSPGHITATDVTSVRGIAFHWRKRRYRSVVSETSNVAKVKPKSAAIIKGSANRKRHDGKSSPNIPTVAMTQRTGIHSLTTNTFPSGLRNIPELIWATSL